jgi:hypothetical protein
MRLSETKDAFEARASHSVLSPFIRQLKNRLESADRQWSKSVSQPLREARFCQSSQILLDAWTFQKQNSLQGRRNAVIFSPVRTLQRETLLTAFFFLQCRI